MPKPSEGRKSMVHLVVEDSPKGGEGTELPLRHFIAQDFTGREDNTPVADRKAVSIDSTNLNARMKEMDVQASFTVKDRISGAEDAEIAVDLKFDHIDKFRPEEVAEQIPQIKKLVELRRQISQLRVEAVRDPQKLDELNKLLAQILKSQSPE